MPVDLFQKFIIRSAGAAGPAMSAGVMHDPNSGADNLIHILEQYAGNIARATPGSTIVTSAPLSVSVDQGMFFLLHELERHWIIQAVTDWTTTVTAEKSTETAYYHYNWLDTLSRLEGRDDSSISLVRGG